MSRPVLWIGVAAALLVLALGAGIGGLWWLRAQWDAPFTPNPATTEVSLGIQGGRSGTAILDQLESEGVIQSAAITRWLLVWDLGDPILQAGEYRFELPATPREVLQKIIDGEVVTYPVTVVEGLTWFETARHLAAQGFGEYETFVKEMRDVSRIADLDDAAETLEGYLYPDTYAFARQTSEQAIVDAMVENFRTRLEALPELSEPRTLRELVILASIVEKEARLAEERALIAGVYANRLRIGMALYADPTIIYALKLDQRWDGNLRRVDLQMDSPYNTYRVAGLPPSPICSPRFDSLVAAAQPADEPYLYFVSRNDGSHVFARTLREHNRNVQVWQKQYWRDRWNKERRSSEKPGPKPPPEPADSSSPKS